MYYRRSDSYQNSESLSGLRGYRIGPVVPLDTPDELREKYDAACKERGFDVLQQEDWIRKGVNFPKMYDRLMEEYGFTSRAQAEAFCKENKLTIHEGPEGMYLVPTDVHDRAPHGGYKQMAKKLLTGKATKEEMGTWARSEKIHAIKHEATQRGIRAVKGAGLAAVKELMKSAVVITIEESIDVFTNVAGNFLTRVKEILSRVWNKIKAKVQETFSNIRSAIKGSLISELLTLINDLIFRTAKNVFRIIRMMWKSLVKAVKIIFSKKYSWKEKIFEAAKVVTAGFVAVIGFSLNEMIEKFLTMLCIPFSGFIAEILSGLFSSIMSAVVLMLFDKLKNKLFGSSIHTIKSQKLNRISKINMAKAEVDVLISNVHMQRCMDNFSESLTRMGEYRSDFFAELDDIDMLNQIISDSSTDLQTQNDLASLKQKYLNL